MLERPGPVHVLRYRQSTEQTATSRSCGNAAEFGRCVHKLAQVHFGAVKSIVRMREKLAEYAEEVRDDDIYIYIHIYIRKLFYEAPSGDSLPPAGYD